MVTGVGGLPRLRPIMTQTEVSIVFHKTKSCELDAPLSLSEEARMWHSEWIVGNTAPIRPGERLITGPGERRPMIYNLPVFRHAAHGRIAFKSSRPATQSSSVCRCRAHRFSH
jgi:hypothetical protein